MPEGAEEGILKGMYSAQGGAEGTPKAKRVTARLRARSCAKSSAGAALLAKDFGVSTPTSGASPASTNSPRGLDAVERWNLLHPDATSRASPMSSNASRKGDGPVVAATDYIKAFADSIRPFVPGRFKVLGTDGFGRSDYRRRAALFFEVDRYLVAVAALKALADDQLLPAKKVADAIKLYKIDPEKREPTTS